MKKVIRLTEKELNDKITTVINEQQSIKQYMQQTASEMKPKIQEIQEILQNKGFQVDVNYNLMDPKTINALHQLITGKK